MNRSIVGLSLVVLVVGGPLWLYQEDPYHKFGFILSLVGTIVLIVGLAIPKKRAGKVNNCRSAVHPFLVTRFSV